MLLDDFVMLGTTVPEPNHDGRVFVCSAGVSREFGALVRVYPLARGGVPRRWDVFRVPLERNPQDSRRESFKIRADRSPAEHAGINAAFERLGTLAENERAARLAPYFVSGIAEANHRSNRASLALIRPRDPGRVELFFRPNEAEIPTPQLHLFEDRPTPVLGSKRFPFAPYLHFTDEGGEHNLQLRDWGTYELMRKHLDDPAYYKTHLPSALHLGPTSSLLVGNMRDRRTAWLVIAVLNRVAGSGQLELALA